MIDELFADRVSPMHPRTLRRVRRTHVDWRCQSFLDRRCQAINLPETLRAGGVTQYSQNIKAILVSTANFPGVDEKWSRKCREHVGSEESKNCPHRPPARPRNATCLTTFRAAFRSKDTAYSSRGVISLEEPCQQMQPQPQTGRTAKTEQLNEPGKITKIEMLARPCWCWRIELLGSVEVVSVPTLFGHRFAEKFGILTSPSPMELVRSTVALCGRSHPGGLALPVHHPAGVPPPLAGAPGKQEQCQEINEQWMV